MKKKSITKFPDGFIWGAGTSAYQVEGAWNVDGKSESMWDRASRVPGMIANGGNADVCSDHYHRVDEDVDMMASIGLTAYRFSVAWGRILPNGTGKVNQKGLDFYDRLIDRLLQKNITPFLTVYHWDHPQVLEDAGGWQNRNMAYALAEYAGVLANHFSDRVTNWMTLNEPGTVLCGYTTQDFPPGLIVSRKARYQIIHHLLLAHGLAVRAIRTNAKSKCEVGIVTNNWAPVPKTNSPEDIAATEAAWNHYNAWLLDPIYKGMYPKQNMHLRIADDEFPKMENDDMQIISSPTDFLGLNCYMTDVVEAINDSDLELATTSGDALSGGQTEDSRAWEYKVVPYPKDHPKTTMGWCINADCLYNSLKALSEKYEVKKLYISENGCTFDDKISEDGKVHDPRRISYFKEHLLSCHRALVEGIPLAGFLAWALIDGIEWHHGYAKRFGLVYVDYENTQKRVLKDSAYWYKNVIEQNGIAK